MNHIADIITNADILMFVDGATWNCHTSGRHKGWSFNGQRCVQHRFFVQGEHFSILPVLTIDGIITHDIIPSSVTADCFH